jgi:hypothetical protein
MCDAFVANLSAQLWRMPAQQLSSTVLARLAFTLGTNHAFTAAVFPGNSHSNHHFDRAVRALMPGPTA